MEQKNILNSNQKIIISLGFIFLNLISSIVSFSIPVFFLQLILGSLTIMLCFTTDYKTAKLWLFILAVSIFFVFVIFLANNFFYGKPYYSGGSDDLKFEQWGLDVYKSGIYNPSKIMESGIIGEYHNSPFFPSYIALLIRFSSVFGGYSTFLPRIANAYFLLWVCMIIKYLLLKYTSLSKESVKYSLLFFALMPNIQYINAHIFRDTFNLLQILLIILLVDFLLCHRNYFIKLVSIIILPSLIYTAYFTRASSLLFAGFIILIMFSVLYNIKKIYIIIGIILLVLSTNLLEIFRFNFYIENYSSYVSDIAGDGLSGFIFNKNLFPFGIILRGLYALISPFPNFFALFKNPSKLLFDVVQLFIYLGVMLQTFSIPFIVKRSLKFDWLSLAFLSWFLAIILSTFTFRHFLLYYPFMSAVAVDGYTKTKPESRKIIIFFSTFTTTSFGVIYILLKILS